MQVTILSNKLPHLSDTEFKHEFRDIHAKETCNLAVSLGIISRYAQGMPLAYITQKPPLNNLPLPEYTTSIWSFAQLSWPSLEVFGASLKTRGYKESAGNHQFATPLKVLFTERLESDATSHIASQPGAVRLVTVIYPLSGISNEEFRTQWGSHGKKFGTECPHYQRNLCLDLSREQFDSVLENTQFSSAEPVLQAGYEEIAFPDVKNLEEFLDKNSKQMGESYASFCSKESFCVALDSVLPYKEEDRGFKQIVMGKVVSVALGLGIVP